MIFHFKENFVIIKLSNEDSGLSDKILNMRRDNLICLLNERFNRYLIDESSMLCALKMSISCEPELINKIYYYN